MQLWFWVWFSRRLTPIDHLSVQMPARVQVEVLSGRVKTLLEMLLVCLYSAGRS